MTIKSTLIKLNWLISTQFGFNLPNFFGSLRGLPIYLSDWISFRKRYSGKMKFMPCLHDRYQEGGATKSEYFWQDLVVARAICAANPIKHVDIGSRVDGFVAHVASFRNIEVFDVRPISTTVPGVIFHQADLMKLSPLVSEKGYCDSLSCLHAIEHFGLGRYGDPINPHGYQQGIFNMARLLLPGGIFYLSTPLGKERVEFNANWVFDPRTIISCAKSAGMKLSKIILISPENGPKELEVDEQALSKIALAKYQLGIFTFIKN
jgi:hypothetical protein